MSYDLSWLARLSPATLAQIQKDLGRNSEQVEEKRPHEGPTVLLEDGRRIPGEYKEYVEDIPVIDIGDEVSIKTGGLVRYGTRQAKRVPLYDNENGSITNVPENTVKFHLGEEFGGPPKGAYTRIMKET